MLFITWSHLQVLEDPGEMPSCINGPKSDLLYLPNWKELVNAVLFYLLRCSLSEETESGYGLALLGLLSAELILVMKGETSSNSFSIRKPSSATISSPGSSNSKIPDCLVNSLSEIEPRNNTDAEVIALQGATPVKKWCSSCIKKGL